MDDYNIINIIEKCILSKWDRIESSSRLKQYSPELIIDNNNETTWVEGVQGNGIGEWIKLTSHKNFEVLNIVISNGYQKRKNYIIKIVE